MSEPSLVPQDVPPPPTGGSSSSATKALVVITLVGVLGLIAVCGSVWFLANRIDRGDVADGSYLDIKLEGVLNEAPAPPSIFSTPDDAPPTVSELAAAIRKAGGDDRINGILLTLEPVGAGWGALGELRDALTAFRSSGKSCVAYAGNVLTNNTYWLASACDQVIVAPDGVMYVPGLSVELMYFKGMLDKLGIEAEYEHVGDFKSAVETFERTGPSGPAAEAYEHLLDGMFDVFVSGVAEGRERSLDEVRDWIDLPTLLPSEAAERGMIDAVAYEDAVRHRIAQVGGEDWVEALEAPVAGKLEDGTFTKLKEYLKVLRASEMGRGDRIAIIHAEGDIMPGSDKSDPFGGSAGLTDGFFASAMRKAREDKAVKAVVVRVNSRGGSALASSNMWREVARTKAAGKPVVYSFADYAASGGYLMATNADWIVAHPGTLTGSIGVFGGKFDLSGAYGKLGLTQHRFHRGELSNLLSLSSPFSDQGRKVFRDYLENFYEVFVSRVAEGRGMAFDAVHEVAQGRVWTGTQALEHGLVDALGGVDAAVAKAAELAEISDWTIRRLPERRTFFELLMEDLANASMPAVRVDLGLPGDLDAQLRRELAALRGIEQSGGVAARMPVNVEIR